LQGQVRNERESRSDDEVIVLVLPVLLRGFHLPNVEYMVPHNYLQDIGMAFHGRQGYNAIVPMGMPSMGGIGMPKLLYHPSIIILRQSNCCTRSSEPSNTTNNHLSPTHTTISSFLSHLHGDILFYRRL